MISFNSGWTQPKITPNDENSRTIRPEKKHHSVQRQPLGAIGQEPSFSSGFPKKGSMQTTSVATTAPSKLKKPVKTAKPEATHGKGYGLAFDEPMLFLPDPTVLKQRIDFRFEIAPPIDEPDEEFALDALSFPTLRPLPQDDCPFPIDSHDHDNDEDQDSFDLDL